MTDTVIAALIGAAATVFAAIISTRKMRLIQPEKTLFNRAWL
jgi:hypothetical protein